MRLKMDWHKALPLAQRVINSSVHPATGFKPSQLVFGERVHLDRHILHNNPPNKVELNLTEWIQRMHQIHTAVLDAAITKQTLVNANKQRYTPDDLKVNELVLVIPEPTLAKKKLEPRLEGPYKVTQSINTTVTLQSLVSKRVFTKHISNLVRYYLDPKTLPPDQVAMIDDNAYLVGAVLQHTVATRNMGPKFLIKWKDYPPEDNTWEPLDHVLNNTIVHQYMRDHKMEKWIPKCHL